MLRGCDDAAAALRDRRHPTHRLHPVAVTDYELAYAVLVTIIAMDAFALRIVLRPLRTAAARRGVSLLTHLKRSTDSVAVTIVVGGACAVIGSVVAGAGLVASQFMGSATPDTVASALIGLLLLVASVLLLHTHRELPTGRGATSHDKRDSPGRRSTARSAGDDGF